MVGVYFFWTCGAISLVNPCHLILFYKENKNGLWANSYLNLKRSKFHPTTWIVFLAKIKPSSLMDWTYGPHSLTSHNRLTHYSFILLHEQGSWSVFGLQYEIGLQPGLLMHHIISQEASLIKAYISTKWVLEEKCP